MNVVNGLDQKKLQDILMNIYKKGYEDKNINVSDFVDDIKQQVMSTMVTSK